MVDRKGSHGDVDVDWRDIDPLVDNLPAVDDCLCDLSVVLREVLAGVNDVYLSSVNSLLKSLPGINESHLAIVVVEVLGNGLVMHVLNRKVRCSSALHTGLYI